MWGGTTGGWRHPRLNFPPSARPAPQLQPKPGPPRRALSPLSAGLQANRAPGPEPRRHLLAQHWTAPLPRTASGSRVTDRRPGHTGSGAAGVHLRGLVGKGPAVMRGWRRQSSLVNSLPQPGEGGAWVSRLGNPSAQLARHPLPRNKPVPQDPAPRLPGSVRAPLAMPAGCGAQARGSGVGDGTCHLLG